MALEQDASGLLLRATVEGRTVFLFAHRAGKEERAAAARSLDASGFAIIDNFLGGPLALKLREDGLKMWKRRPDAFETGAVGGGHNGEAESYAHNAVRGDKMTILTTKDNAKDLPVLAHLLTQFDSLMTYLGEHGGGRCAELRSVHQRSSPMFAVYPGGGARYMRHVDNPDGNGRLLTCLYYLNIGWREDDGGCLRLFEGETGMAINAERSAAHLPELARVAPVLDRVCLFWSDARVPHEVLPAYRERLAISVWFHAHDPTGSAALRAVAEAAAATHADAAALRRAKVLAEGSKNEQQQQQSAEDAYLAALKHASNTLRTRGHVQIRAGDQQLVGALEVARRRLDTTGAARSTSSGVHGGVLTWADEPLIEGKAKILLHQLLPSRSLAAGCTQLMLARGPVGATCWLKKPPGAKALVLLPLASVSSGGGVITVHARRCAFVQGSTPPGWPKASSPFVVVEQTAGWLHVFECDASAALYVRLEDTQVTGIWSFGAEGDARAGQSTLELLPDPAMVG